jgi:hypothetical protein
VPVHLFGHFFLLFIDCAGFEFIFLDVGLVYFDDGVVPVAEVGVVDHGEYFRAEIVVDAFFVFGGLFEGGVLFSRLFVQLLDFVYFLSHVEGLSLLLFELLVEFDQF